MVTPGRDTFEAAHALDGLRGWQAAKIDREAIAHRADGRAPFIRRRVTPTWRKLTGVGDLSDRPRARAMARLRPSVGDTVLLPPQQDIATGHPSTRARKRPVGEKKAM